MFRLLGFIIGSFVSIAALVLMVGVPNFHLVGDGSDENRYEVAIEKLREKQKAAPDTIDEPREQPPNEEIIEEVLPTPEELRDVLTDISDPGVEEALAEPLAELTPENAETAVIEADPDPQPEPQPPALPEWHSFWTPFRSELAAEGFVRRLESVTGLDYRIVKVKTGVYQVAFSYADDSERTTKLAQISAATGLDLTDALR